MVCVVLRGVAGAGKSSFADILEGFVCCSADDYFMRDGEYIFDAKKLGVAHQRCKDKFIKALKEGKNVVIANTNTTRQERDFYLKTAREMGYWAFSVIVENTHQDSNIHGVPEEKVNQMREKLKNNLDL